LDQKACCAYALSDIDPCLIVAAVDTQRYGTCACVYKGAAVWATKAARKVNPRTRR
jgi:hypothetical protein